MMVPGRSHPLFAAALFLACRTLTAQAPACNDMALGQIASLNGFVPVTSGSPWNTDISAAPVDPNSSAIIGFIGSGAPLHADFGSGEYRGQSIGIPYQIVAGDQPKVNVSVAPYADESDPGSMPIPAGSLIEGYPNPGDGDRHVLVLDKDACWLYELYHAYINDGAWSAASVAIWEMTVDMRRPYTWTSADAAGLPLFPGLTRYDELEAGAIRHALRFTVPVSRRAFTPPASHWASRTTDSAAPPMGVRLRLKAGVDISSFAPQSRVILTALKTYGMILADNGSALFISGAPDSRWDNDDLSQLRKIRTSDFDVVRMDEIYRDGNLPSGPPPAIDSFMAEAESVTAGDPVTLVWSARDSVYNIIAPEVGPVRGDRITVMPAVTTTYTLYSTNQFGRSTASLTVAVH
jgi:hypothetical protein